jgi:hypothetical protein
LTQAGPRAEKGGESHDDSGRGREIVVEAMAELLIRVYT